MEDFRFFFKYIYFCSYFDLTPVCDHLKQDKKVVSILIINFILCKPFVVTN